jgi:hypothetical protein
MIKAKRSNLYTIGLMSLGKRVNQPSWRHPETTGKGKLEVG